MAARPKFNARYLYALRGERSMCESVYVAWGRAHLHELPLLLYDTRGEVRAPTVMPICIAAVVIADPGARHLIYVHFAITPRDARLALSRAAWILIRSFIKKLDISSHK